MIWIFISDLHLTANPADEYRWQFFDHLKSKLQQLPAGVKTLFILGDLTVNKDNHSAKLVNRIVGEVVGLYRGTGIQEIVIIRGNHDGIDNEAAFFDFLKYFSFIKVITKPQIMTFGLHKVALLPHTKTPNEDWATIEFSEVRHAFMHATFSGARGENNTMLEGDMGLDWLRDQKNIKIVSGDVHVPQQLGNVTYVGAPYPIKFGDKFQGRVLVRDDHANWSDWRFPTIKKAKAVINGVEELNKIFPPLKAGDQLKVELVLAESERHEWQKRREQVEKWCETKGVHLFGVELKGKQTMKLRLKGINIRQSGTYTPDQALSQFATSAKVEPETIAKGKLLLKNAKGVK